MHPTPLRKISEQVTTKKLAAKFEEKIKESNWTGPRGQIERVWTPHKDDVYEVQTEKKMVVPTGPPPKKSLKDLP